jgi:hypothetical protein
MQAIPSEMVGFSVHEIENQCVNPRENTAEEKIG